MENNFNPRMTGFDGILDEVLSLHSTFFGVTVLAAGDFFSGVRER